MYRYQGVSVHLNKFMEHDEQYGVGGNEDAVNVVFGLYADEDIVAADGSGIPEGGLVSVANVGEDMTARFNTMLPFGRYYVQEISTDEKYVISGEKHIVTFEYAGQDTEVVDIDAGEFVNDLVRGSVHGQKVGEHDEPLANAVFGMGITDERITDMTVKELATEWMFICANRIKDSTASNYRMKLNKHILPALGDRNCRELKSRDIYVFMEDKLRSGLSARYVGDIVIIIKSMFRYASREYGIRNALEGIVMPKKRRTEARVFTKDEQQRLSAYISSEQNCTTLGIALSMYTGLRIGELCALQWQDIDIKAKTLTVRKTIQRIQCFDGKQKTRLILTEPKSTNSNRIIPIPDFLIPMINRFKDKESAFVLSGSIKPVEPRTMQNRFKRVLDNAGLPAINYHSLRHAFATSAIELGFDIKTLSEILGHSSVEVTLNRYVHSSMDRKRVCMNLISNVA